MTGILHHCLSPLLDGSHVEVLRPMEEWEKRRMLNGSAQDEAWLWVRTALGAETFVQRWRVLER